MYQKKQSLLLSNKIFYRWFTIFQWCLLWSYVLETFYRFQNNRENKNMPKTEQNKSERNWSYQKGVPKSMNLSDGIAKGSLVSDFVGHPMKYDSEHSWAIPSTGFPLNSTRYYRILSNSG